MKREYPRTRRITHRSDFEKLLNQGTRVRTLDLDVRGLASPARFMRIGLVVPKGGRTAVARNKLKRRIRELVRLELLPLNARCDAVIRCRLTAYERSFEELALQIKEVGAALMRIFEAKPEA